MTRGRRWAASTGEDELLAQLYQQITERQALRFAVEYDMAAGLDRYRAWLAEPATEAPAAIQLQGSMTLRAAFADASVGTASAVIGGPVALRRTTHGSTGSGRPAAEAEWDAARAVTALYSAHYRSFVRLAVLLVRDLAAAEEIVQDSFIALHAAWRRLRDNEKALSYLRQSVVNRSRSVLRHHVVADKTAPKLAPDLPAAQHTLTLLERSAVISALWALPPKQREVLVLRYYAGLTDAQIASATGISIGAVKSHTARGVSSLRAVLDLE